MLQRRCTSSSQSSSIQTGCPCVLTLNLLLSRVLQGKAVRGRLDCGPRPGREARAAQPGAVQGCDGPLIPPGHVTALQLPPQRPQPSLTFFVVQNSQVEISSTANLGTVYLSYCSIIISPITPFITTSTFCIIVFSFAKIFLLLSMSFSGFKPKAMSLCAIPV